MKNLLLFTFLISIVNLSYSQTTEYIKASHSTYLWGEGSGTTLKKADKEALAMLISQISTQVESSFSLFREELSKAGNADEYNESFHSVIKTYSGATLKNTERIIVSNEPEAKVFRYIRRSDVAKVFKDREYKIIGFIKNGETSVANKQIADGLRYYYWALTLLKSHPDGSHIECVDRQGTTHLVATWLPLQINNIFSDIDINVAEIDKGNNYTNYTLDILYKNSPVENFDYEYWNGADWSNLISARDGIGIVELYGVATQTDRIKIKAEYIFEGEARIDRELEDVLSKMDAIPFRNSYYTVKTVKEPATEKIVVKSDVADASLTEVSDKYLYKTSMDKIIAGIKTKDYASIQNQFTTQGYEMFNKLINYGNAKIIANPELHFVAFNDNVICRSIPMCFNFKTNNKQFVENVSFYFDKEGRVENLTFGLSKTALNNIVQKDIWSEKNRMILVTFLENYKTAYALKRIGYIEKIFADDALIITGSVVKVKPNEVNHYRNNRIVKYNRQSKQQYIKNLNYSFNSKEYVNIKFEKSKIKKAGQGGDIFGVQIKQNYFSSNYGDEGYLFLMVDLNNPDEPLIHVRTWQPEIDVNDSIYGLSDFN